MQQEIIEIGVVSIDLHELRILDEASYFVRPRRWDISLMCTQLTGITHENVRNASPLREVLDAVSKRFEPRGVPCCAWGEDVSILAKACKSNGFASPFGRSIDLSIVFQGAFALKDRAGLKTATEIMEIEFDGFAHGALPDARNTALVHRSLLRRLRCEPESTTSLDSHGAAPNSLSPFAQKLTFSLGKGASD